MHCPECTQQPAQDQQQLTHPCLRPEREGCGKIEGETLRLKKKAQSCELLTLKRRCMSASLVASLASIKSSDFGTLARHCTTRRCDGRMHPVALRLLDAETVWWFVQRECSIVNYCGSRSVCESCAVWEKVEAAAYMTAQCSRGCEWGVECIIYTCIAASCSNCTGSCCALWVQNRASIAPIALFYWGGTVPSSASDSVTSLKAHSAVHQKHSATCPDPMIGLVHLTVCDVCTELSVLHTEEAKG